MSERSSDQGDDGEMAATHWEFDVDQENPEVNVVEVIAEFEGRESSELSSLYDTIDDVIERLFSDPPSPEAQAQLEFTYEGTESFSIRTAARR